MNPKSKLFIAACTLASVALACQSSTSELTPEATSTSVPFSTSLPSLPTATDTPTTLPAATLAPPLGFFTGIVAFSSSTGQLQTINMANGEIKLLIGENDIRTNPLWSADGIRIAYLVWNTKNNRVDLALLDIASGEIHLVLEDFSLNPYSDNFPLSSDGSFALYESRDDNGYLDIYRMDTASGEITNLTSDTPYDDEEPSLSPDGKHVAFSSRRTVSQNVWIMNTEGKGLINLTPNDQYFWRDMDPAWSPDGSRIAFFRCCGGIDDEGNLIEGMPGGPAGLWMVNADGSNETLILEMTSINPTYDPSGASDLIWSPDGNYIAFRFDAYNPNNSPSPVEELWVVDVSSGEVRVLLSLPSIRRFHGISWSPDSRAVLANHFDDATGTDNYTVYVAAVDGSGVWNLFDVNGGYYARWSP